ncbi:GIY-YIG nuclease family protein [Dyella telluris]|uniref:GIY-YIG nuclease family protein n=1 Tax=Dyella telluris TaxID=2763498 RepID=A0A7G8Q348_9GAMM|nr:GIY-YIG nuclease family protein [Dyella telluris]QNK01206.1 GIY-YIG nuclease family protein [Dyella telluris]
MDANIAAMDDFVMPRTLGKGRTYVYLFPWREQDLLKVGFSRQPLVRLRTLHRRFFDVFDLDRGCLLETGRLAQARKIERDIILRHAEQRSPPPLVIPDAAAGYSEWFRGVCPEVTAALHEAAARESVELRSLRDWLQQWFESRGDGLYEWSLRMLEAMEYETFNVPPELQRGEAARSLRYVMDACEAVGLSLPRFFPDDALAWRATLP